MLEKAVALVLLLGCGLTAQVPRPVLSLIAACKSGDARAASRARALVRPQLYDLTWRTLCEPKAQQTVALLFGAIPEDWKSETLSSITDQSGHWSNLQREMVRAKMLDLDLVKRSLANRRSSRAELAKLLSKTTTEGLSGAPTSFIEWWKPRIVTAQAAAALRGAATPPNAKALRSAAEAFQKLGDPAGEAYARSALARLAAEDGRLPDAKREFQRSRALLPPPSGGWRDPEIASSNAEARLAILRTGLRLGFHKGSANRFETQAKALKRLGRRDSALESEVLAANARWLDGDRKRAIQRILRLRKAIPRIAGREALARTSRTAAHLLRLGKKTKECRQLISSGLRSLKTLGAPVEATLGLRFEEGVLDVDTGNPDRAIGLFKIVGLVASSKKKAHLARLAFENAALIAIERGDPRSEEFITKARSVQTPDPQVARLMASAFDLVAGLALVKQGDFAAGFRRLARGRGAAQDLGATPATLPGTQDLIHTDVPSATMVTSAEILPQLHAKGQLKSLSNAYYAVESRRLQQIAAKIPDRPLPAQMAKELAESNRQLALLRRSLSVEGHPLPGPRIAQILSQRKRMLRRLRSRHPMQALKRFPVPTPFALLRKRLSFWKAGLVYPFVSKKGYSYILVFNGGGRWKLESIEKKQDLGQLFRKLRKLQTKRSLKPSSLLSELSQLTKVAWEPIASVFSDDKQIFIVADQGWEDLSWGVLGIDLEAAPTSWKDYPFLAKRLAISRISSATLLQPFTDHSRPRWLRTPRLMALSRRSAKDLSALTEPFANARRGSGRKLSLSGAQSLAIAAKKSGDLLMSGGILLLDQGCVGGPDDLGKRCRPDLVILIAPTQSTRKAWEGAISQQRLKGLLTLVEGPSRGSIDAVLHDFLLELVRHGTQPSRAWGQTLKRWLGGEIKVKGRALPDADRHPALWSRSELFLGGG